MADPLKPTVPNRALEDAMAAALASVERFEKQRVAADDAPAPPGSDAPAGPEPPVPVATATIEADGSRTQTPVSAEAELKDQLLRLAADFDNYRKRAARQMEETRKFGTEKLLVDLLLVLDNFDRALDHAKSENGPLIQGVRMVAKQLTDTLAQHGVVGFTSRGEPFDPERHEAIAQMPSEDQPPGSVLEEVVKGYMIHDRLLRAAQVVVAAAPAKAPAAAAATADGKNRGGGTPAN
jgi:molecular chaperone GrpE